MGERQVCDKEEETQNRKRGEITQTTRVCTTTDILEPLYEIRTRPGYLDTQKIPRDAFRKVCELDVKSCSSSFAGLVVVRTMSPKS